jgi:hypothetical protein
LACAGVAAQASAEMKKRRAFIMGRISVASRL